MDLRICSLLLFAKRGRYRILGLYARYREKAATLNPRADSNLALFFKVTLEKRQFFATGRPSDDHHDATLHSPGCKDLLQSVILRGRW